MKRETLSWLRKGTRDGDVRLTREDCADVLATDAENRRLRKAIRQFTRLVDSPQYVYLLTDALKRKR